MNSITKYNNKLNNVHSVKRIIQKQKSKWKITLNKSIIYRKKIFILIFLNI